MTTQLQADPKSAPENRPFFRPRRLTHVNFWVADVERVKTFYTDVAGIEEAYRRPGIKGVFLSNGNTYHDFAHMDVSSPIGVGKMPGLHHFAFELETEMDLVDGYRRALASGYSFTTTMTADVAHSVYGADTDGNGFEIYADVERDWRAMRSGVITKVKPGWKPGDTPPVAERCYPVDPDLHRIEQAAFHARRTAHVALVAKDYEGVYRTYTDLVGLTPIHGGIDSAFCVLGGTLGEKSLSIFRARPDRRPGVHHSGVEVWDEDDLERGKRRLEAVGVRVEHESDHPMRRSVFVRDPCGQLLQFFVDREKKPELLKGMSDEVALYVL
jgi:catechol 2,3-dioxygenase